MIAATRQQYEQKMAVKDADVAKREAAIREQQENLLKEKEAIDEQVSAKLKVERDRITIEEIKKAKLLAATDLEQKTKEIADLEQVLKKAMANWRRPNRPKPISSANSVNLMTPSER